jgi:hypothetical protein
VQTWLLDFAARRAVQTNQTKGHMNWLSTFLENVPDDPFYRPRKPLWLPREMSSAPELPPPARRKPTPRMALLINPFYAKSPHGSFGKHVLTPTLALTSLAGAVLGRKSFARSSAQQAAAGSRRHHGAFDFCEARL